MAGQDQMRKRICALIMHHMELAKSHHGKDSDQYLRYYNLLEDIRVDHLAELETENKNPQNTKESIQENDQTPYEGVGL